VNVRSRLHAWNPGLDINEGGGNKQLLLSPSRLSAIRQRRDCSDQRQLRLNLLPKLSSLSNAYRTFLF
jgi:hypothetical protein